MSISTVNFGISSSGNKFVNSGAVSKMSSSEVNEGEAVLVEYSSGYILDESSGDDPHLDQIPLLIKGPP